MPPQHRFAVTGNFGQAVERLPKSGIFIAYIQILKCFPKPERL